MNIRRTVGLGLVALPFVVCTVLIVGAVIQNEQYLQLALVLGAVATVSAIIFAGVHLIIHDQP